MRRVITLQAHGCNNTFPFGDEAGLRLVLSSEKLICKVDAFKESRAQLKTKQNRNDVVFSCDICRVAKSQVFIYWHTLRTIMYLWCSQYPKSNSS